MAAKETSIEYDNHLIMELVGPQNANIHVLEEQLKVSINVHGNVIYISGEEKNVETTSMALEDIRGKLGEGLEIDEAEVEASIRMMENEQNPPATALDVIEEKYMHQNNDEQLNASKNKQDNKHHKQGSKQMNAEKGKAHNHKNGVGNGAGNGKSQGKSDGNSSHHHIMLKTHKKHITPRTPTQAKYMEAMGESKIVFGLGPAGTGKTYLAVAKAVTLLVSGEVDRIILTRPAVEAGEHLGFLPGDLKEKVDPYLRPLHDALSDMLPSDEAEKFIASDLIEVAPLAFMRGRTLSNCVAILDEAQNTTPVQMKMFLTRLGENASMVVTGDMSQADLPTGQTSGLRDAHDTLQGVEGISFVHFSESDVVRHKLVSKIINAYNRRDRRLRGDADTE